MAARATMSSAMPAAIPATPTSASAAIPPGPGLIRPRTRVPCKTPTMREALLPAGGVPAGSNASRIVGVLQGTRVRGRLSPGPGGIAADADVGVAGIAAGIADDIVALAAINPLPAPARRSVRRHETRRPHDGWGGVDGIEEQSAEDGIGGGEVGEANLDFAGDVPHHV